jgi:hypothetical protein
MITHPQGKNGSIIKGLSNLNRYQIEEGLVISSINTIASGRYTIINSTLRCCFLVFERESAIPFSTDPDDLNNPDAAGKSRPQ